MTGLFAIMGNLDDYNDKGWPGMFTKTFQERAGKVSYGLAAILLGLPLPIVILFFLWGGCR